MRRSLLPLRYRVQSYAWGSRTFLSKLTGRGEASEGPEAELWMGAHPSGESKVLVEEAWVPLAAAIASDPVGLLGAANMERYGAVLPYLFKVLAIAEPLSLQVHPSREQAAEGFAGEESARLDPSERNYRDSRGKPELVVALEPMWVLRGLLEAGEIRERFSTFGLDFLGEELSLLDRNPAPAVLGEFVGALLRLEGEKKRRALQQLGEAVQGSEAGRASPDYWVKRLLDLYPDDSGVLAPLFLQLVELAAGQALFQSPGVLHTYLEGAAIEVLGNSDNVLRAALTTKRVDLPELLAVADTRPADVEILEAEQTAPGVKRWSCSASELGLVRLSVGGAELSGNTLRLCLCVGGGGRLRSLESGEEVELSVGSALAITAAAGTVRLVGDAVVFCATPTC